jgi:PAS domain-containing protein
MAFLKSNPFFQIHPSHESSMREIAPVLFALAIGMTFVSIFPLPNALEGFKDYLPLHMSLEGVSIVIAMQVSGLGWNVLGHKASGNIIFLSSIFFGVAILDFSHLLSYEGMPNFVTPSGPDKGIAFWLAARLLLAIGLLVFALSPLRPFVSKARRYASLSAIFALVAFAHWLFLFHPNLLTNLFFTPGRGLSALKINTEYAIIALNAITAFILWRAMYRPQPYYAASMFAAVCVMAMSELFFTLYADVVDVYNVLGHIYKAIAYLFVYRAIFVTAVQKPYEELSVARERLRENNQLLDNIIQNIPHMIFLKHASDLRYALFNKAGEELTGFSHDALLNHTDYEFYPKDQADFFIQKDRETLANGVIVDIPEEPIETLRGTRLLHTKKIPIKDAYGQPLYLFGNLRRRHATHRDGNRPESERKVP